MEALRASIRRLQSMLVPELSFKEQEEIHAELLTLESQYKALERLEYEKRIGVSLYGSYFSNSSQ